MSMTMYSRWAKYCFAAIVYFQGYGLSLAGPVSPLYLTAGDQRTILVVQGNSVINSWAMDATGGDAREYPIAVVNGVVRTSNASPGDPGLGAEYTTAGTFTGTTYAYPGTIGSFWDGTTDGTHNYGYDFSNGGMYRMDLDWQNPVLLFNGPPRRLSVTYDPTDDSLWVADWTGSTISNLDMTGAVQSSFVAPVSRIAGLALDHADGTLWFGTQDDLGVVRTLYQYSKAGVQLSTETYAALQRQNFLGGEFELPSMIEVTIDIKFCSNPNAFNCKKKGVLPVTIFGTDTFDVADIDISTLQLCTADLSECTTAPRDWSTFDRGSPDDAGVAQCDLDPTTGEELDFFIISDGFLDLDVAFEASEVQTILGDFCTEGDKGDVSEALVIIGETYDGVPIFSVPADDNTGIDRLVKANN